MAFLFLRKDELVYAVRHALPLLAVHASLLRPRAFAGNLAWIAAAAWLALLGFGNGFLLLRRARVELESRAEAAGLSLGLGWGLLGTLLFIAALAQLWRRPLVLGALVVATAPALWGARAWIAEAPRSREPWTPLDKALFAGIAVVLGYSFLGCLAPDIFYDGLAYHLPVPAFYWARGGAAAMPRDMWSGMPMLVEMLYGAALIWDSTVVVHLIHWTFGAATGLLVWGLARRACRRRAAGLFAALIWLCTPLTTILSWKAGMDLGWAFFQTAAVCCLAARLEGRGGAWTLLGGLFLGFQMATKYPAWPAAFLVFCAAAALCVRARPERARETLKEFAAAGLLALVVLAPWPGRNAAFFGNPVYPFLEERLHPSPDAPRWKDLAAETKRQPSVATAAGLETWLADPFSVLTSPMDDQNSVGLFHLLALPLLAAAFAAPGARLARAALTLLWLQWSLFFSLRRFFLAEMPLVAVLCAAAAWGLFEGRARRALVGLGLTLAAAQFLFALMFFEDYRLGPVVWGAEEPRVFLAQRAAGYPLPPYPAYEYLNEKTPPDSKVLILGEARTFYLKRAYVDASLIDVHPLVSWLRESRTPEELAGRFKAEGVTHLLFARLEYLRLARAGYPVAPLTPEQQAVFDRFTALYLKPLVRDQTSDVTVFEVKSGV